MKYIISYDLRLLGARFQRLKEQVHENFPNRVHLFDSFYIVNTNLTAHQIRDALIPGLGADDALLVLAVGNEWEGLGLSKANIEFLKAE